MNIFLFITLEERIVVLMKCTTHAVIRELVLQVPYNI